MRSSIGSRIQPYRTSFGLQILSNRCSDNNWCFLRNIPPAANRPHNAVGSLLEINADRKAEISTSSTAAADLQGIDAIFRFVMSFLFSHFSTNYNSEVEFFH